MRNAVPSRHTLFVATAAAFLMVAHHVGAKSLRSALFLSEFDVKLLSRMVIAAATVSLLMAIAASWALRRFSPDRLIPAAFAASAFSYVVTWELLKWNGKVSALVLFLLVNATGTLLMSGMWSLISECFDPNTARKNVGRVASGGTAGLFAGGVLTERIGAGGSVAALFPVLIAFHAACTFIAWRIAVTSPAKAMPDIGTKVPEPSAISLREMVRSAPYFVPLALLVLLSTTGAALIDYVFQSQAAAAYTSSGNLLRFFAVFNAAVGLATFLLQSTASQYVLSKIGLGKTLATLPVTTALSSFAAMAVPGLPATGLAKAAEQVFSRSFFRAGYELFYAPVPAHQKRAARPIIDVGFDRLGDGLGFGLVQVVLMVLPASASQAILSAAVIVGIVGFWIALRLDAAYIGVLESSLLQRADEVKQGQFSGNILSSATMIRLPVSELQSALAESGYLSPEIPSARTGILDDLTSGDLPRIQRALRSSHEIPRLATPVLIDLLTNDAVYSEVTRVLRKSAAENVGQLIDRLVDQDGNWKLRLRIPKVLSHCPLQRAADGLLLGLEDRDFQVRMRCGQALAAISSANTSIRISPDAVFSAVQREAGLEECAIEDLDPLDPAPEDDRSPMASTLPRKVNDSYLEYLFILLSLVLPRAPLRVAYHGLYTDDVLLRGTALEYLESMLPPDVREAIWPYLGEMRKPPARSGAKPSIADELLQSEAAIQLNLQHRYGSKPTG